MDLYRCFAFEKTGTRPGYQLIHAEADGHARRIAMDFLLDDPGIEKMEVWRGADLAFRLTRNQARLERSGDDSTS